MSDLPPYSPYDLAPPGSSSSGPSISGPSPSPSKAPTPPPPPPSLSKRNLAGPIQTCSFADNRHDYFKITRTSPITYSLSLTTDPTPLYYLEVSPLPTTDPAIQLYDASHPVPLAAARLQPHVTIAARICTRDPASPSAKWRPLSKSSGAYLVDDYSCITPLEHVPGLPASDRFLYWKCVRGSREGALECWLTEPLLMDSMVGNAPLQQRGKELLVARYGFGGAGFVAEGVLELRRGGGLEFELGVVVQAFAVLEVERRRREKKKK